MTPKIPIAAITDEYSPELEKALEAMSATSSIFPTKNWTGRSRWCAGGE